MRTATARDVDGFLRAYGDRLDRFPGLRGEVEIESFSADSMTFTFHGFRFRVLRRERNRITALRIVAVPREAAELDEKKPKRAGTAF